MSGGVGGGRLGRPPIPIWTSLVPTHSQTDDVVASISDIDTNIQYSLCIARGRGSQEQSPVADRACAHKVRFAVYTWMVLAQAIIVSAAFCSPSSSISTFASR
jgi:hypothetical protein